MSASINGALISYILGEYINLNNKNYADNRTVCYISYLYVSPDYRGHSIATNMMKILFLNTNVKVDGWMLVFDTHKKHLKAFYSKLGFTPDILYKNYSQHEVYFKQNFY
jgi:ribosomal protein S18 acetylase RimI-like enzyme